MTITYRGSTGVTTATAALGSTSTTVAYTQVGAGRMAVITAAVKPDTAGFGANPAGWTKIGEATGGTGTTGADTGLSKVGTWYRILDSTETGSVTITATSGSALEAVMEVYSTDLGGWETPVAVTGNDNTHAANISAALGTWAAATAVGDVVHVGHANDTDNTAAASVPVLTQTGTTYGTVNFRSRRGNSSGNDGSVFTWDAFVTAGGSTNAPTAGFTWAASSCGPLMAVRIRDKIVVPSVINPRATTGAVAQTAGDTEQTVSPTLTIAPSSGDLVMVGITVDKAAGGISAATIVPNQNVLDWDQVGPISDSGSPSDHRATWLWRIWNTGDPTALTFTCSSAVEWSIVSQIYYGTSTVTPIGAYAHGFEAGASTTSHLTATITPASTQPWVVTFFGDRSGSTWTAPSTYVERADTRASGTTTGISPSHSVHDSNRTLTAVPVSATGVAAVSSSTAVWFIAEIVPVGETSNPPPQVVLGPWCGNVTDTSMTVMYGFSGLATTARLKVSTTSDLLTSPIYGTAAADDAGGLVKLSVSGLTANTLYYYGVEGDGVLNAEGRGSFRTDPTPGAAASYSIAFGSCQFTVLSTGTFDKIRNKVGSVGAGSQKARRLIHMGDIHYEDWSETDTYQMIYDQWFLTIKQPLFAPMLAQIPMTYMWDNHDWGGNGSWRDSPRAADVAAAYRKFVPHYPITATDGKGAWQSWVIGRVRYIQIDPRSQRDEYTAANGPTKTMLGTEQKTWLKAQLQEPEPLKILCNNMYWRSEGGLNGDRWSSFADEWQELTTFMNNDMVGDVFVIFGDTHALVADDGSTAVTGGIPQAGGAPFQQGSLDITETWSAGSYDTYPDVFEAFGWLDIVDNGTTIGVTYSGITSDDDITRVTMALTFGESASTSAPAGGPTGTGAAPDAAALVSAPAEPAEATGVAEPPSASTASGLPSPQIVLDAFTDGTIGGDWDTSGAGPQATELGGTLNLTTTLSSGFYGVARTSAVDVNEAYVSVRLTSAGDQGLASYAAYPLGLRFSASNEAYWLVAGGQIACYTNVGGSVTFRTAEAYSAVTHAYIAVGEQGGQLRWMRSTDGVGWVEFFSMADPFGGDTTAVPYLMVGTGGTEASTTTMQVDDLTTWGIATAAAPDADAATGAGAAPDASAASSTSPSAAAGSGAGLSPTAPLAPQATTGAGSGAAPVPTSDVLADAGWPSGAGVAPDATASTEVAVSAPSESAGGAGVAESPTAGLLVSTPATTGTGVGSDPSASPAATTPAAVATGIAPQSGATIEPVADAATAAGVAPDAAATTVAATSAPAGPAEGAGDTPSAHLLVDASPPGAVGAGVSHAPSVSLAAPSPAGAGGGMAPDAAIAVGPTAEAAITAGDAPDVFMSTAQGAPADVGVGAGVADDPGAGASFGAEATLGVGAAGSPVAAAGLVPVIAAGVGAAPASAAGFEAFAAASVGSAAAVDPVPSVRVFPETAAGAGASLEAAAETSYPAYPGVAVAGGYAPDAAVWVSAVPFVAVGAGLAVGVTATVVSEVIPHIDVDSTLLAVTADGPRAGLLTLDQGHTVVTSGAG